jgi:hypothetical protein
MSTEQEIFEALKYRIVINSQGDKFYLNAENKYHREEGPALEFADGTNEWRINGKIHREDGPAVIYSDGQKIWFIDDKQLTEKEFNKFLQNKNNA